jgi:hypothetical protein
MPLSEQGGTTKRADDRTAPNPEDSAVAVQLFSVAATITGTS